MADKSKAILAIEWFLSEQPLHSDPDTYYAFKDGLENALVLLKTIKNGRWEKTHIINPTKEDKDNIWVCSLCSHSPKGEYVRFYDFCPYCGAKMERSVKWDG